MRSRIASPKVAILAAAAALALAAGCATKSTAPKYSGWLKDYSGLTEQTDSLGNKVEHFVSPDLTAAKYSAVIIEPVVFYPEPQTSPQVPNPWRLCGSET